ncbi:MAG: hypothetical protein NC099_00540 [Corallococcus sp.]|nr:hypothetical protein [Corallococcus sp.]
MRVVNYEGIVGSNEFDILWKDTEEYRFCALMINAGEIQSLHCLGIIICSVALMTAVLCWARIDNEGKFPKITPIPFAVSGSLCIQCKFMNKGLLKIQIPCEIVFLCTGSICYAVLQFATVSAKIIPLFAVLIIPQFFALIAVALNVLALALQYKRVDSKLINLGQSKL